MTAIPTKYYYPLSTLGPVPCEWALELPSGEVLYIYFVT